MPVTVRSYVSSDFVEVHNVIDAATQFDRTRRVDEETLQKALDEHLLNAFVAVNQNQGLVGVITWEPFDRGYFLQGWIHPDWRGKGAGSALFAAVEDNLRWRISKRTGCVTRVYGDIPGVEALFRNQGYDIVRRFYKMSVNLVNRHLEVSLPSDISLKTFEPGNLEALVEADNEFFADHWGAHPRSVSDWRHQLIDSHMHDPTLWVIAWDNNRIVGECLCNPSLQDGPDDGWVTVVGVRRQWRGNGLGRVMLSCGLQRLREAGFETAGLHVDAENAPAVHLYRQLGFEVTRTRLHFRKSIVLGR